MMGFMEKKFEKKCTSMDIEEKINLENVEHMSGIKDKYIKLSFQTLNDLIKVRTELKKHVEKNKANDANLGNINVEDLNRISEDLCAEILDIREYDVFYHTRVMIDMEIRCCSWYRVTFKDNFVQTIDKIEDDSLGKPEFTIMAYDIECSKQPLKFPDAEHDIVYLISYVINGDGYLITNREIISEDIQDFVYGPIEAYETDIMVYNEVNEKAMLMKFIEHIREVKPFIMTTYNGDRFDWPFLEKRFEKNGIDMSREIGIFEENGEYYGRYMVHLDCFYWVERDSYLPQGSHGLKAVTRAKLHYNPVEVDPEEMLRLSRQKPQAMAEYAISDAVATYYLYMKHINDFISALCTIVPLGPDDILRRGSGTLCENLLMAEAYRRNIIMPNKTREKNEKG